MRLMSNRKFDEEALRTAVSNNTTVMGVLRDLNIPLRGSWHAYISNTIKKMGIPWPHYQGFRNGLGGCKRATVNEVLTYNRLNGRREHPYKLRQALLEKGIPHACEICGLGSMWQEKPLTLQVDHRDGDPLNNNLDNLRFLCPNCHTQTPSYGSANKRRNFVAYPPSEPIKYECVQCGLKFTKPDPSKIPQFCSQKCSQENRQKINWPSDEDLSRLVWSKSLVRLAQDWGVSDNAIRHRCKSRGIPVPPRGYWTKQKHQDVA